MTDRSDTAIVGLYEDNAGAVYVGKDGETWGLGPVTADMAGEFAQLAAAWASGDWEPNEGDGQVPADLDGLVHIATWIPGGIFVEKNDHGERLAGAGGDAFIGHVLVDLDEVRPFLAGLDGDVERARHLGHLIEQARQLQGWLARLRAQSVASAAEYTTQTRIANRLGVSEGRVSQMVTEGRRTTARVDPTVASPDPGEWTPGAGWARLQREMPHLIPAEISEADERRAHEIIGRSC
jgi:hypothetical protein